MNRNNNNGKRNGNGNGAKRNGNGNGGGRNRPAQRMTQMRRTVQPTAIAYPGENRRAMNNRTVTLSGSDFLTKLQVKAAPATAADRILATYPITPSAYPGTRVTQLSELWERYRLRKFNLRYVPAVPVTLACQFVLYIDLDPLDDPRGITDVDTLVRQAVAQAGAQQWNFHVPKSIQMASRRDDQLYYTGEDKQNLRFSQQGTAYLIQITNPVNSDGDPVGTDFEAGSIFIDWTVDFQTPQINPEATIATSAQLKAVDVTGLEFTGPDAEPIDLVPGVPRTWYIITLSYVEGAAPFADANFEIYKNPNGEFADASRITYETTGQISVNAFSSGSPKAGCIVAQSDANGSLIVYILKTGTSETSAFVVVRPLYNITDISTANRAVVLRPGQLALEPVIQNQSVMPVSLCRDGCYRRKVITPPRKE